MDQGITLEQVQKAMTLLREQGERVSRRNVRSITGGGMSTVHRLMSLAEEEDAVLTRLSNKGISETFLSACRSEIALQTKIITENYEQQICALKTQQQELVDALADSEDNAEKLSKELSTLKATTDKEQRKAEKDLAIANESIRRLEIQIDRYITERDNIESLLEDTRADNVSKQCQIKSLKENLADQDKTIAILSSDLNWARNKLNMT